MSTHISYALAYAENPSREAVFNAMQARHVYAATANIVADYRCGTHMMGDEFSTDTVPKFNIHLEGTGPFAKVVFVKDDEEVFTATPNQAKCDVDWTDPHPTAGQTSYYYAAWRTILPTVSWSSPVPDAGLNTRRGNSLTSETKRVNGGVQILCGPHKAFCLCVFKEPLFALPAFTQTKPGSPRR